MSVFPPPLSPSSVLTKSSGEFETLHILFVTALVVLMQVLPTCGFWHFSYGTDTTSFAFFFFFKQGNLLLIKEACLKGFNLHIGTTFPSSQKEIMEWFQLDPVPLLSQRLSSRLEAKTSSSSSFFSWCLRPEPSSLYLRGENGLAIHTQRAFWTLAPTIVLYLNCSCFLQGRRSLSFGCPSDCFS